MPLLDRRHFRAGIDTEAGGNKTAGVRLYENSLVPQGGEVERDEFQDFPRHLVSILTQGNIHVPFQLLSGGKGKIGFIHDNLSLSLDDVKKD